MKNLVPSAFLILLALYVIKASDQFVSGDFLTSPASFPKMVAYFIMIMTIPLLYDGIKKKEYSQIKGLLQIKWVNFSLILIPLLLTVLTVYFYQLIGFIFSSIIYLGLLMFWLFKLLDEQINKRKIVSCILLPIILTLVIYQVFGVFLGVPLP